MVRFICVFCLCVCLCVFGKMRIVAWIVPSVCSVCVYVGACLVICALLHGFVFCVYVCVYVGVCLVECAFLHAMVIMCVLFVCMLVCVRLRNVAWSVFSCVFCLCVLVCVFG